MKCRQLVDRWSGVWGMRYGCNPGASDQLAVLGPRLFQFVQPLAGYLEDLLDLAQPEER